MKISAAFLSLLVCMLLLPSFVLGAKPVEAAKAVTPVTPPKPIKLFMDGKELNPEVAPLIKNDNTLVPVRIIAEEIGAKVSWDGKKRLVTVEKEDVVIQLTIDNRQVMVKDKKQEIEVAPIILEGNTMLPVRFIGELLGVKFNWDKVTYSVHMFKPEVPAPSTPPTTEEPETPGEKPNPDPNTPTPSPSPDPKPDPGSEGGTKDPGTGTEPGTDGGKDVPVDQTIHVVQSIETNGTDLIVRTSNGVIKPTAFKLDNPNRIVFDLPYAELDTALKNQMVGTAGELVSNHPLVQKIRYSNFSSTPPTVRITLDLIGMADFQMLTSTDPNVWSATISEHKITVVIDAGHGGTDPGAISLTGKKEKDFTLPMAKKVSELLAQDKRITVLQSRPDDVYVDLDGRVKFANDAGADLFLSIHGNKHTPTVTGVETYYYRPESLAFANIIHKYTVAGTGFTDRRVRKEDFRVINKTKMPAVLVEVGYLSNKNDEAAMYKDDFQNQVAASLAAAIKEYLNLK
ncbi:N-acetylmuramoyl-L-alanine amidase family protein [Paenibacillus eucommiae]|uniref:N-acetylmuramoyl-L-alanine amidase n=1 Tax=Paenibacillus eucommiae TaxID=1355755 RepID=A0ABS4J6R0_9BACL|nr:N-acetylmuramoyl-L-alanine amidase family protein [Paenibacillus eucommiae]MBP1994796.1 N-acetylmuramoyl-L-alanine amidase [Paenibacillus eucommiae]